MSDPEVLARPPLAAVKGLLDEASLPSSDVDDGLLEHFFAMAERDELVGVAGLEPHGSVGLLRSLVVRSPARRSGIGKALVARLEAYAAAMGIETLYLLTDTAPAYFRRLGYRDCPREAAPGAIRNTREFSALCPDDAAFMCKRLNG